VAFIEMDDGVQIHVEDAGTGRPIVFLHGWPVSSRMFEYQFLHLVPKGYRCVGIDLRGFGRSQKPWGDYDYDVFADDVRQVLKALELKDVTLAGFSMGGAIALHYMARHKGKRVARLALLGAAAPSFTRREGYPHGLEKSQVDEFIRAALADRPQMLANFGGIFFHRQDRISKPLADWFHGLALEAMPHATVDCLRALRDSDLRPDMAKVAVPTAIFHGIHDQICPFGFADAMYQGIKGARLIRFEESGHGLFVDEMDKLNEELGTFAAG